MADFKLEAREGSQMALTMTVKADVVQAEYAARLAKYAKELTLKGFRKGKAPLPVVERQLGEAILSEVSYDVMEKTVGETIEGLDKDKQPLSFSTPVLQNEDELKFEHGKDIEFTVVYDVFPSVELGPVTGMEFEVLDAAVSDADVDAEIEKLREQNSTVITKEGAAALGDIATLDFAEVGDDGKVVEDTKREDFTFTLGSSYNYYKIDGEVVGMEAGQEKDVEKTYGDDETNDALRGRTVKIHVKLTALKERVLPEVDDEFAQDIKEEYKTVDDLKKHIREDLEKQMKDMRDNEAFMMAYNQIRKTSKYELPASLVRFAVENETRDYLRQVGRSADEIDRLIKNGDPMAQYIMAMVQDRAKANIEQQVILEAIQKSGVITVPEDELKAELEKQVNDQMDEDTKKRVEELVKDQLEFSKVPRYILDNNTFKATGSKLGMEAYTEAYYDKMSKLDGATGEEAAEAADGSDKE